MEVLLDRSREFVRGAAQLAGEGALVGLVAGAGLGAWESRLHAGLGIASFMALAVSGPAVNAFGSRRAAGHPSVVLISIDTLRADRLGCLGYRRGLTPHLDALAHEGTLFGWRFASGT